MHQHGGDPLTTNHGMPLSDNQNSLRAGDRGPTLLEDFALREKIFHFDHERIPERIVHARGSGAHGFFECTAPIPGLTRASLFQTKGERIPVFCRISTVAGGAGSVDTPRDVRGFAVKFYTHEGNWDLVGNNIPVFFIQDAMKFPDLIHAVKMESDRGFPQAGSAHDTFWDFVSLMPESTHMIMWAMSDRAIPRSLRMIEGFGVHTFRFLNDAGTSTFVKFHWRPRLGLQSTLWDEAVKLAGADPDFHRRDLWEAIDSGSFPEWDLAVQTFDQELADTLQYDILDATKLIPEEIVPLKVVGRMVLDRNPTNFFAETEQVAFMPTNIVPGIDFSDDPLLQGRMFSYLDTQKSRFGTTNFHQIPINAPKCPVANFQRDGLMQNLVPTGRANYEPNSLDLAGENRGPRPSAAAFTTYPEPVDGPKVRVRSETFADHYSQARMFFRSQTPVEQTHIVSAFVFELSKVTLPHVRTRVLANLVNVDAELAGRVAAGLGCPVPPASRAAREPIDLELSPSLSIVNKALATLSGRRVGILFTDGSSSDDIAKVAADVRAAGATPVLVAPRLLQVGTTPKAMDADGQLAGTPSVTCDAIAIIVTEQGAAALAADAVAVQFVADAYAHLKAIGHTAEAQALLDSAHVGSSDGVVGLGPDFIEAARRRFYERDVARGS
ncbi:MAG: catalase [Actinomycetota bacterium]|nr:catalase [Actinomycetota bacterium]